MRRGAFIIYGCASGLSSIVTGSQLKRPVEPNTLLLIYSRRFTRFNALTIFRPSKLFQFGPATTNTRNLYSFPFLDVSTMKYLLHSSFPPGLVNTEVTRFREGGRFNDVCFFCEIIVVFAPVSILKVMSVEHILKEIIHGSSYPGQSTDPIKSVSTFTPPTAPLSPDPTSSLHHFRRILLPVPQHFSICSILKNDPFYGSACTSVLLQSTLLCPSVSDYT